MREWKGLIEGRRGGLQNFTLLELHTFGAIYRLIAV
jgi:hypothetical protein